MTETKKTIRFVMKTENMSKKIKKAMEKMGKFPQNATENMKKTNIPNQGC